MFIVWLLLFPTQQQLLEQMTALLAPGQINDKFVDTPWLSVTFPPVTHTHTHTHAHPPTTCGFNYFPLGYNSMKSGLPVSVWLRRWFYLPAPSFTYYAHITFLWYKPFLNLHNSLQLPSSPCIWWHLVINSPSVGCPLIAQLQIDIYQEAVLSADFPSLSVKLHMNTENQLQGHQGTCLRRPWTYRTDNREMTDKGTVQQRDINRHRKVTG